MDGKRLPPGAEKSQPELERLGITDRELGVWQLLCTPEELPLKAVPDHLPISAKTAETHRQKLYAKTGVHTRVGLVLKAIAFGIIACPCAHCQPPNPPTDPITEEP
jgi:DNA-binding CsgD family transcriptional regulator